MELSRDRYPNFDVLRLLFALGVVTWHVSARNGDSQFPYPFLAVPSFLSISGFVILRSWRSAEGPAHFWIKRATRLLPAFFVCFLLIFVLFGFAAVRGALATYLAIGTFNTTNSVNPPIWTLSAEETIYIALSLVAALVTARRLLLPLALAFAAHICLGGFYDWNERYLALLPAFVLGLYACETGYRLFLGPVIPAALAIGLSVWINYFHNPSHVLWALWSTCSIFATLELGRMKWTFIKRKFTDISYGVYIYHFPILLALFALKWPGWSYYLAVPIATCAFAYASSVVLEQPAIRARKAILSWLKRRSSAVEAPLLAPAPSAD